MARDHSLEPTRRAFSAALIGLTRKSGHTVAGGFVFESQERGHTLRDKAPLPTFVRNERVPVVIVGAGIAGLSCAWWLERNGFRDFVLLELEDLAGGNARWGENDVSAYPWGAHYLPVPGKRATLVRTLCEELGLLQDGVWNERHLCHSPQERLFINNRWQDGIEPVSVLSPDDQAQFARFNALIAELRATGAFRIPSADADASQTAATRALDSITFAEWMRREGLYSTPLRWYLDYSTRDDYGASAANVSAWAGVHYFASREPDEKGPLTWPEGNGWIARRLSAKLQSHLRPSTTVRRIARNGTRWSVLANDCRYDAAAVVFAAPMFLASWIVDPAPPAWPIPYAPWLVANVTLDRWPQDHPDARQSGDSEPAWDNVFYDAPSLGYVVATHQNLAVHQPRTVWTFYWALTGGAPADMRRVLLGGDYAYWSERVWAELERVHPDIRACARRLDIHRLGHAMPSPTPGMVFHPERVRRARHTGSLVYAHSDLSALPLFEEAQERGVSAARHVLTLVGGRR